MKILINASNLSQGGALQVARSFLKEIANNNKHEYHVICSKQVNIELKGIHFCSNFHFYVMDILPSKILTFFQFIRLLKRLEKKINPNIVFTVFGPSYWTPKSSHVMGFANSWCIYPFDEIIKNWSLYQKIKIKISIWIKNFFVKKNTKYFIVETEDYKEQLKTKMQIPDHHITVISNTYSDFFNDFKEAEFNILPAKSSNCFRFITISTYYLHKNLTIINRLIPLLEERNLNIQFVLTIDEYNFNKFFHIPNKYIFNFKPVPQSLCPQLYYESDALFLPTLLECFSASYVEAMKMNKPIITSDRTFARTICANAAIYFDPLDPVSIADGIEILIEEKDKRESLILEGKKRLQTFHDANKRAELYIKTCENVFQNN